MSVLEELGVSAGVLEKLRLFQALVGKWNPRINLVAKSTLPDLWARHIEDSAFLCLHAPAARFWADFGAGGGFPGLVAATILQDRGADTRVVLVESDLRKATFLREAARQMGLAVEIHSERISATAGGRCSVCPCSGNTGYALHPCPPPPRPRRHLPVSEGREICRRGRSRPRQLAIRSGGAGESGP